jgi:hypothetical protein
MIMLAMRGMDMCTQKIRRYIQMESAATMGRGEWMGVRKVEFALLWVMNSDVLVW